MPGQGKKRKGYYIQSAKGKVRKCNDLRPGCKGFLISCNGGKHNCHEATLEAYRILNEYADIKYGPEKKEVEEEDVDGDMNIEDALQKEVSDIKKSNAKGAPRRFQRMNCKINNSIFIQSDLQDPTELLDVIYEDIISTQIRKTKRCQKFLPVHQTCYASREKIVETVKEVCKPIFVEQGDTEKAYRFCFMWKVSSNSSPLSREEVYQEAVDYVYSKQKHIFDSTDPEIAINIHVIGNTCCVGVLRNYAKFNKYNIDMAVKDAVAVKREDGDTKDVEQVEPAPKEEKEIKDVKKEEAGEETIENDEEVETEVKTEVKIEVKTEVKTEE